MKTRVMIVTMVAAAALAAAPRAQAGETVRVEVPFAFVAGDHQLPAGDYEFVRGDNPRVLRVFTSAGGHVATLVTRVEAGAGGEVGATFLHIGDEYFLKTISGTQVEVSVPSSHAERLARATQPARTGTTVAVGGGR
jgi:hypothetical protein